MEITYPIGKEKKKISHRLIYGVEHNERSVNHNTTLMYLYWDTDTCISSAWIFCPERAVVKLK